MPRSMGSLIASCADIINYLEDTVLTDQKKIKGNEIPQLPNDDYQKLSCFPYLFNLLKNRKLNDIRMGKRIRELQDETGRIVEEINYYTSSQSDEYCKSNGINKDKKLKECRAYLKSISDELATLQKDQQTLNSNKENEKAEVEKKVDASVHNLFSKYQWIKRAKLFNKHFSESIDHYSLDSKDPLLAAKALANIFLLIKKVAERINAVPDNKEALSEKEKVRFHEKTMHYDDCLFVTYNAVHFLNQILSLDLQETFDARTIRKKLTPNTPSTDITEEIISKIGRFVLSFGRRNRYDRNKVDFFDLFDTLPPKGVGLFFKALAILPIGDVIKELNGNFNGFIRGELGRVPDLNERVTEMISSISPRFALPIPPIPEVISPPSTSAAAATMELEGQSDVIIPQEKSPPPSDITDNIPPTSDNPQPLLQEATRADEKVIPERRETEEIVSPTAISVDESLSVGSDHSAVSADNALSLNADTETSSEVLEESNAKSELESTKPASQAVISNDQSTKQPTLDNWDTYVDNLNKLSARLKKLLTKKRDFEKQLEILGKASNEPPSDSRDHEIRSLNEFLQNKIIPNIYATSQEIIHYIPLMGADLSSPNEKALLYLEKIFLDTDIFDNLKNQYLGEQKPVYELANEAAAQIQSAHSELIKKVNDLKTKINQIKQHWRKDPFSIQSVELKIDTHQLAQLLSESESLSKKERLWRDAIGESFPNDIFNLKEKFNSAFDEKIFQDSVKSIYKAFELNKTLDASHHISALMKRINFEINNYKELFSEFEKTEDLKWRDELKKQRNVIKEYIQEVEKYDFAHIFEKKLLSYKEIAEKIKNDEKTISDKIEKIEFVDKKIKELFQQLNEYGAFLETYSQAPTTELFEKLNFLMTEIEKNSRIGSDLESVNDAYYFESHLYEKTEAFRSLATLLKEMTIKISAFYEEKKRIKSEIENAKAQLFSSIHKNQEPSNDQIRSEIKKLNVGLTTLLSHYQNEVKDKVFRILSEYIVKNDFLNRNLAPLFSKLASIDIASTNQVSFPPERGKLAILENCLLSRNDLQGYINDRKRDYSIQFIRVRSEREKVVDETRKLLMTYAKDPSDTNRTALITKTQDVFSNPSYKTRNAHLPGGEYEKGMRFQFLRMAEQLGFENQITLNDNDRRRYVDACNKLKIPTKITMPEVTIGPKPRHR